MREQRLHVSAYMAHMPPSPSVSGAELLERALHDAFDAVVITTPELDPPGPTIVYVNRGFEQMTQYSAQEVLGSTPRILQGPRTDRRVLDALRQSLRDGQRFHGEAVNYRKDGSQFLLEWRITGIRDQDGRITHWISFQREIPAPRNSGRA